MANMGGRSFMVVAIGAILLTSTFCIPVIIKPMVNADYYKNIRKEILEKKSSN